MDFAPDLPVWSMQAVAKMLPWPVSAAMGEVQRRKNIVMAMVCSLEKAHAADF